MNRLKQASTWAGIGGILQACKAVLPQWAPYLDAATLAAGMLAGVINEQGKAQ